MSVKQQLATTINKYNHVYDQIEQAKSLLAEYKVKYLQEFQSEINQFEKERQELEEIEKLRIETEKMETAMKIKQTDSGNGEESQPSQEGVNDTNQTDTNQTSRPNTDNDSKDVPPKKYEERLNDEQTEAAPPVLQLKNLNRLFTILYDKLCRIYHPDRPSGNEEKFLKVQEEYERQNLPALIKIGCITKSLEFESIVKDDEVPILTQTIEEQLKAHISEMDEIKNNIMWIWGNAQESEKPGLRTRILQLMRKQVHK